MKKVINALSIDVEDWFCVHNMSNIIKRDEWNRCELRIVDNTERILSLLSKYNVKATFFVLGWIAERVPELVRSIVKEGHEIASHGYSHTVITEMTPESFELDLKKALSVMKDCSNAEILGFRAPSFSITSKTLWALDVLQENGIRYDSSMFPVGFHPDYGIPDMPLAIHQISEYMTEVPLSCAEIRGLKIPCSGGGYFRIFPYNLTAFLMRKCNGQGRPVIFYLHPWEIDAHQPKIKLPIMKRFRHYFNLNKTFSRLERLLNDFEFAPIREVINL